MCMMSSRNQKTSPGQSLPTNPGLLMDMKFATQPGKEVDVSHSLHDAVLSRCAYPVVLDPGCFDLLLRSESS